MKKLILLLCLLPLTAIAQPRNCRVAKFRSVGEAWSTKFSCRTNEYMINSSTCRTGMYMTTATTRIADLRSIRCEFEIPLSDRRNLDCRSDRQIKNAVPSDPKDLTCLPGFTVEAVCCRR